MRIQHTRVRLAILTDMSRVSVTLPSRQVNDCACLYICRATSTGKIVRGVRGEGKYMVSVFFADTIKAKARQTYAVTSIILASSCGD